MPSNGRFGRFAARETGCLRRAQHPLERDLARPAARRRAGARAHVRFAANREHTQAGSSDGCIGLSRSLVARVRQFTPLLSGRRAAGPSCAAARHPDDSSCPLAGSAPTRSAVGTRSLPRARPPRSILQHTLAAKPPGTGARRDGSAPPASRHTRMPTRARTPGGGATSLEPAMLSCRTVRSWGLSRCRSRPVTHCGSGSWGRRGNRCRRECQPSPLPR